MDQSGSTGDKGAPTEPPSGWSKPPSMPSPAQPGPKGFVYADVPNRAIAYLIDIIVLAIINFVIFAILGAVGLRVVTVDLANGIQYNYILSLVFAALGLAISAGYFIYTWTRMRATLGMKALGLQVGDAGNGTTLTQDQAIKRWLALGAIFGIVQAFSPLPLLSILIYLAAFGWFIFLVYTTYSSPTKQGWHDIFAHTMVVQATNTVA
jgi:uncharacterized RDD family membrane protein YckC